MNGLDEGPLQAAGARLAASHAAIAQALLPTGPVGQPGSAPAPSPMNQGLLVVLANRALNPLVREHPWWLVGAAALLGAAFVTRPFRRAMGAVVMAAVLTPAASSWAVRELTRALGRPAEPARPRSPGEAP